MKRFSIAVSAILLTCGLAFFAIAIAQRDSRNQLATGLEQRPEYADQAMAPIQIQLPSTEAAGKDPFASLDGPPDNKLRPTLHEISAIKDSIREPIGYDNESPSKPNRSFSEPPRIVHDGNEAEQELASLENDTPVEIDSSYELQESAGSEGSEVNLAGAFESTNGFPANGNGTQVPPNIQPLPTAKLLPPPSVGMQPAANASSNSALLPPSLSSPFGNPNSSSPSPTGSPAGAPPNFSADNSGTPVFATPTLSSVDAKQIVGPKLMPPSMGAPQDLLQQAPSINATQNPANVPTSEPTVRGMNAVPLPANPPSLQSPTNNSAQISTPLPGQSNGGTLKSDPANTPFGKTNSSWPNSSIQSSNSSPSNPPSMTPIYNSKGSVGNSNPPSLPTKLNGNQAYGNSSTGNQLSTARPLGTVEAVPGDSRSQNMSSYGQRTVSNSFEQRNTSADALLASNSPGTRQLDGSQNPSLQIHKRAPEEVQVGQPATFTLLVRNVGTATAYEVNVTDSVPKGTKLSKTNPPAQARPDGSLVWSLGEMAAGSEQVLTAEIIPETEGEIGSVASVTFAAQASVRTVSTQPKLVVTQSAVDKVLLGQPIKIQITVANEGSGVARSVSLEEDVPPGLRHPLGATLGVPLGDLVPGQSRTTQLELVGVEPGVVQNYLRAVSSNSSTAESTVPVEVVAPQLKLTAGGPKLRYLERQATYQISVTNTGTAMAHNVELFAYLPRGMQFNSAVNEGEYLSDQHAVTWGLEELAVGATATTEMTLLPVEEGDYVIRLQGRGDGVRSDPFEKPLRIEGQSELAFSIEDDNDPIETDEKTTYSIRLTNNGTRVDQDVSLMVELPPGAKVLQVNAPTAYNVTREGILFEPLPQVKAKDQLTYRFSVELTQEGTQVVRAHVKSKLRPLAIVKEESTQVYRDE